MRSSALLFVAFTILTGCATAQAPRAQMAAEVDHGDAYAATLAEAFDSYEAEVATAAALSYASQAEADAVMLTLSPARLEHKLRVALAHRNLTLSGFAAYAQNHPNFFLAQQKLHWGRLDAIQQTVASIATRVQPSDEQMAMLASDTNP